ncbi:helix-turn-helix transcriptional regulator [Microbacterium sp. No. 7]|uniref:helix-turn-helix transcriptional regulator n=1 Tax=Microbacterium sp. No. 7 TaxID=1714373 RepID=UPI0006D1AFA8|nr:AraC family transcriptional regulator [Microbacterium sp. No. 7]ALJ18770.1 hypothetical protein AOA12_02105 [Microbacterium sp. No. 7]
MTSLAPVPDVQQDAALEHVLGGIAIRVRHQRRITALRDEAIAIEPHDLTVGYVVAGSVRLRSAGRTGCDLSASTGIRAGEHGIRETLSAGDALITNGRHPASLAIDAGSGILLSRLRLDEHAAHVADLLPSAAWVRGFAEHEPGAAALALHMGVDGDGCPSRDGDLVICRTMATTLLQSVIRAWSTLGCAPDGWPAGSGDAFLDRVADAVRADPGRDWTVDALASVGAMSRTVFAERFRAAFGLSPAQFVTDVRMRAARRLLAEGGSIGDVARELGYGSDEGFSRAFRRHAGLTPSAWRTSRALDRT